MKSKSKNNKKKTIFKDNANLNIRLAMALSVFVVLLSSSLLAVAIYYLLVFFDIIKYGTLPAFWILAIIVIVCNIVGAILASIICAHYTKPIDDVIKAMNRLSGGDFDVDLPCDKDLAIIRQLKQTVNKTARELNSIEVMRNDFIDTISHEYKTPVSSINGFARRLKGDNLTDEQREYVDIIIDESKHLSSLTTNILLLNKYENTQIVPDVAPYSLDEQIRKCAIFLQQDWMQKNISLEGKFDPVTYCGNEDMMNQVWINLIKNAIKCTGEGGSIYCSVYADGGTAVVKIKDTGCGMDNETVSHIFANFYKADSSRNTQGNGLGLSIVKRIVDLNNGKITINSKPYEGTEFTVTLPLDEKSNNI